MHPSQQIITLSRPDRAIGTGRLAQSPVTARPVCPMHPATHLSLRHLEALLRPLLCCSRLLSLIQLGIGQPARYNSN